MTASSATELRHHMLIERLLFDVVGLPWSRVHGEADRWPVSLSDSTEQALTDLLDDPATCPHGHPIPGSSRAVDDTRLVALDKAWGPVVVQRVSAQLEEDPQALALLERAGLVPGRPAEITGWHPSGIAVAGAVADTVVAHGIATQVLVAPHDQPVS